MLCSPEPRTKSSIARDLNLLLSIINGSWRTGPEAEGDAVRSSRARRATVSRMNGAPLLVGVEFE